MRALAGTLICTGLAMAPASPAQACSYVLGIELAQPSNGAGDVPTNVVPWLRGRLEEMPTLRTGAPPPADGGAPGLFVVLREDGGAAVPIDVAHLEGGVLLGDFVEIRPSSELRPDTLHVIEVSRHGEVETYSFTTGAGPLDEMPGPIDVRMEVSNNTERVSCDDNTYACVGEVPRGTTVRATVTSASGEVEADVLWDRPGGLSYARIDSSVSSPFCIEIRRRNLAGALGPSSVLCSDGAPTYSIATGSRAVTCDGHRVRTGEGFPGDEGGCSTTSSHTAPWLAFTLLVLALRTRSRERSSHVATRERCGGERWAATRTRASAKSPPGPRLCGLDGTFSRLLRPPRVRSRTGNGLPR